MIENTTFRKLGLFPCSGEGKETPTLLVHWTTDVKVKVILRRRSDGQSVLVSGTHLGPETNFPLLSLIIFRQLRVIDVRRPLWREVESVLLSFFWAWPAQSFSDLNLTGLMSIFYCLYFWNNANLEGQVPVFISPQEQGSPVIPPGIGFV
jgi:hypothetical protein